MTQPTTNQLNLNIVPITFSDEKVIIGYLDYENEDTYSEIREQYWQTHAFRFDSRVQKIANIPIRPDVKPLGLTEEVNVNEHLLLIAKAIQHSILTWLASGLPIIRAGKKLIFWGQAESALLLTKAVTKNNLTPIAGLEVAVRYDIDCRWFLDANDNLYLGLVMDVRTANIIDIPIEELLTKNFSIAGKYVCRRRDIDHAYLRPGLDLLGRVSQVNDQLLFLTDSDDVTEVTAKEALLEPRWEYLQEVINTVYGSKAKQVLAELKNLRGPFTTASGKLDQIKLTLKNLKKRTIVIGENLQVSLGDLLSESDPQFPAKINTERPTVLVGAQGRTTTQVPDLGIARHGPYLYMQHTKNAPIIAVICEGQFRGRVDEFIAALRDGFPQESWRNPSKDNPYQGGLIGKFRLSRVRYEIEETIGSSAEDYRNAVKRLLTRLPEAPALAIVQTQESFKQLRGNQNPYFVSKAEFMKAGIPTQSIFIEKIDSSPDNLPYILNQVALAVYAKLDGIPWVIATRATTAHELVVGLGTAEVSEGRLQSKTRYVGTTTVFQGDGRYMVWGLTRDALYEDYVSALLENLRTTIDYIKERGNWQTGDRVRLVFHVYKRLKDLEAEAIKTLVQELIDSRYSVEFAFLDISWTHPYYLFYPDEKGKSYWVGGIQKIRGKGIPQRGVCLQLDKSRGLLHLTGPGDIKTDEQGLPQPLLVELHSESTFVDMTYLLRQIYNFTYMSWQSFFPATMPVTIKYSQMIARLLGNLKLIPGWDSTVVSVGPLRGSRWFL